MYNWMQLQILQMSPKNKKMQMDLQQSSIAQQLTNVPK